MKQHKKANVAAKLAARPVKYNLMVGYDPILETEVSLILQNNHLETKIATETYFYMKGLTKEEVERIKKLVQDVKKDMNLFQKSGVAMRLTILLLISTS